MKIRSSVTPTPIVSVSVNNQQHSSEAQPSVVVPPPPKVEVEPFTVDLGDKLIELQPGELAKVVDKLNQTARVFNHSLQFQMSEGKQVVIRVLDIASGQVVREIPPEKFLDAHRRMEDALGLLIDMRL